MGVYDGLTGRQATASVSSEGSTEVITRAPYPSRDEELAVHEQLEHQPFSRGKKQRF
jgi:hypothetical protein